MICYNNIYIYIYKENNLCSGDDEVRYNGVLESNEIRPGEGFSHTVGSLTTTIDPNDPELVVAALTMVSEKMMRDTNVAREFGDSVIVCKIN